MGCNRESSQKASKPQSNRFIEAARALGADEDEEAFRSKLKVIARQKPKDGPAPDESGKP